MRTLKRRRRGLIRAATIALLAACLCPATAAAGWEPSSALTATTTATTFSDTVVGAPDGRVTAVWTRGTVVEARQLTTATGALSPTVTVAEAGLVDAARDAQGRVTVLYQAGGSLKVRRIYPDLSLSPELTIVTNVGSATTAADTQGRFLVAWSGAGGVRARILDLDGALSPTVTVAGGCRVSPWTPPADLGSSAGQQAERLPASVSSAP